MKIAIIRRKFTPYGGAERVILRIISGLQKSGAEIELSVLSEEWENETNEANPPFTFIQVPVTAVRKVNKIRSFIDGSKALLREHSFDITQSHERMSGVDICRLGDGLHLTWMKQLKNTLPWYQKIWLSVHPTHRMILSLEREMFKDDHTVFVANSPMIYRELISNYQVKKHRIYLIENGIDTSAYQKIASDKKIQSKIKIGLNPNFKTILFLGSGFRRKGAFELVEAMRYLNHYQLIIVGEDKHQNKIKQMAEKLGISDRIKIMGPQKNVNQYLDAADIFCLPSLYESFSNSLLEALASGIPAVVTEYVGIYEAIKEHQAGIVAKRTATDIAKAIETVNDHLETMSQNAYLLAQKYDLKITTQKWLDLYSFIKHKKSGQASPPN